MIVECRVRTLPGERYDRSALREKWAGGTNNNVFKVIYNPLL